MLTSIPIELLNFYFPPSGFCWFLTTCWIYPWIPHLVVPLVLNTISIIHQNQLIIYIILLFTFHSPMLISNSNLPINSPSTITVNRVDHCLHCCILNCVSINILLIFFPPVGVLSLSISLRNPLNQWVFYSTILILPPSIIVVSNFSRLQLSNTLSIHWIPLRLP